jgi:hypothetical protein
MMSRLLAPPVGAGAVGRCREPPPARFYDFGAGRVPRFLEEFAERSDA